MNIQYPIDLDITLRPTTVDPVQVSITVDHDQRLLTLNQTTTVNFNYTANAQSQLTVELVDQQAQEGVQIVSLAFFGIANDKFAWAGVYQPKYHEPWATEQRNQGVVLKQHLSPHTYLSWPGKWTLTFDVPVFTWIHMVRNLGWIYG